MLYVGGAVGMRNRGTYSAATTYYPNDIVQYGTSTYVATATITGVVPTNTTYWGVLAAGAPAVTYASDAKWGTD